MTINTKVSNRLSKEKSPYLLQHAHNPVDWFPWGEEAFEKAKREDKPVFLSIGYSTCHWCHVMERESFEDLEVADILNKNYISIKVDKEERPDIDNIYMTVCSIMTNNGGWPLTIIMTPDKYPFFAGTYLPKRSNYLGTGLIELLELIDGVWKNNREQITKLSSDIYSRLKSISYTENKEELNVDYIHDCYYDLEKLYQPEFGGFSIQPKFPLPHYLVFLLRYYKSFESEKALAMAEKTLQSMYCGGIYDHVGKGFSRYSTDSRWLIPHFEKMLYDNALLIYTYTEAYLATKKEFYKMVAENIIEYVVRELMDDEGGFYCAEDADSEGVEGKYYLWSIEEINEVLGKEDAYKYINQYGITNRGNYNGKNIINLIKSRNSIDDVEENFKEMNEKLLEYRSKREHPFKDDKILSGWNGLMIAALSYAGRVFDEHKYIRFAEKASKFILKNLTDDKDQLYTRFRHGEISKYGFLDDYVYLIWGLIELYEATLNEKYLEKAINFNEKMINLFEDKENGGLFFYSNESEELVMRPKEIYDGALPSGNSVAVYNMIRLSNILENEDLNKKAYSIIESFSYQVRNNPTAYCFLNIALLQLLVGSKEIVIAGDIKEKAVEEMIEKINELYIPFSSVVLSNENTKFVPQKEKIGGKVTSYICQNYACSEPVTDIHEFVKKLQV